MNDFGATPATKSSYFHLGWLEGWHKTFLGWLQPPHATPVEPPLPHCGLHIGITCEGNRRIVVVSEINNNNNIIIIISLFIQQQNSTNTVTTLIQMKLKRE